MTMPSALYLALKNLKLRREGQGHNLLGAVLAIALSLIPLVVVIEVSNGMIEGITRRFVETGTYHLQISLYEDADPGREEEIIRNVESIPDITAAFSERQGLGILFSPQGRVGAQIRGVPSNLYARDEHYRKYLRIVSGTFSLAEPDSILLGRIVADELGVSVGDEVKLLTVKLFRERRYLPRISRFRVRGIFSTGYQDMDKTWIYVPLETAEKILPLESSRRIIGIKTKDPFGDMQAMRISIHEALPDDLLLYRINTWFELEENQYRSFRTTKTLLVFIMFLILVVAAVNVSSTMMLIVMENTQEIGILKSMGAGPGTISFSFLLTGFLTGAVGSVLGVILGLACAVNINELIRGLELFLNRTLLVVRWLTAPLFEIGPVRPVSLLNPDFYLETIPIRITFAEIFGVTFFAVLLSTLASLLPARRASRLKPLDVLRRV